MAGNKRCMVCKAVVLLAGLGALNWALVAFLQFNLVGDLLGPTVLSQVVYALIGLAGVGLLVSLFKPCPCGCKHTT